MFYTSEGTLEGRALEALNLAFEAEETVSLSAISAWEIGMLASRGRLPTTAPPLRYFKAFAALPGIAVEAATPEILLESSFLPQPIHRDPADRIIVATARALDMTIVTSDRRILSYATLGHVRALAC